MNSKWRLSWLYFCVQKHLRQRLSEPLLKRMVLWLIVWRVVNNVRDVNVDRLMKLTGRISLNRKSVSCLPWKWIKENRKNEQAEPVFDNRVALHRTRVSRASQEFMNNMNKSITSFFRGVVLCETLSVLAIVSCHEEAEMSQYFIPHIPPFWNVYGQKSHGCSTIIIQTLHKESAHRLVSHWSNCSGHWQNWWKVIMCNSMMKQILQNPEWQEKR